MRDSARRCRCSRSTSNEPSSPPRARPKGGNHPDALTTRGTLALGGMTRKARAPVRPGAGDQPQVPRAWVGRGLPSMLAGEAGGARRHRPRRRNVRRPSRLVDRRRLGVFRRGRPRDRRARFETALAIDPTFAESQGSLAVIDILDGNVAARSERATVALRLDRAMLLGCAGAGAARGRRRRSEERAADFRYRADHADRRQRADDRPVAGEDGRGRRLGPVKACPEERV